MPDLATYNVYYASARQKSGELAEAGWKQMIENSTALFNEVLEQQKLPAQEGVLASSLAQLCELKTHTKDSLHIPTKTIQPVDAFGASIGPAVDNLTDDSDISSDHVTKNEPYEISVANFPNISAVSVVLVPVNVSVAFGFDYGTPIATLDLKTFEVSQQRLMKFSWTPRASPGKYYLKAFMKLAPLYASYSSVFRIET